MKLELNDLMKDSEFYQNKVSIDLLVDRNKINVSSTNSAINILAPNVNKKIAISFSNILVTSKNKTTIVNGKIRSNNGIKYPFTIQVSFYDKTQKLLGAVIGSISNLQPTRTKIFTARGTGDYSKSASYKINVML